MCYNKYDTFTQCSHEAFHQHVHCGGMGSPKKCKGPDSRRMYQRSPLKGKCYDCVIKDTARQVRGKIDDPWGEHDPYRSSEDNTPRP